MNIYRWGLVPIALVMIFTTACTGPSASPTPTPVVLASLTSAAPATQTPLPLPTETPVLIPTVTSIPSPTEIPVYGLGQVAQFGDLGMAISKAIFINQQLQLTFEAKNNGLTVPPFFSDSQIHVSQAGQPVIQTDLCQSAGSPFFGFLQPGDFLSGTYCWKGATVGIPIKVDYLDPANKVLATWIISKPGEATLPVEFTATNLKADLHQPGEAVLYEGLYITLDKLTVTPPRQNNMVYVYADFVYENKGASDVTIPKNLTGDISVRAANGEPMAPTIGQSGCAATNLDDIVLKPGKSYSINLCFLTSGSSPHPGGRVILTHRTDTGQFDFINWAIK